MKVSSLTLGPQEFLILKLVCTQPPEVYQLPLNCSVPGIGLEASALGKLISSVIFCIHLSLQMLG